MKRILPSVCLATVLVACAHQPANQHTGDIASAEQRDEARTADREQVATNDAPPPVAESRAASTQETARAPNNTGVNERDRNDAHPTPMDQGNGEIDIDLTQRIRKAVMADDSLSFTAKNAKIITRDGRVTLRGPVGSAAEKDAIYKCAVSAAGVGHVTNELEVAAK